MSNNGNILAKLVEEDFGTKGSNRWIKAKEHDSLVIDMEKGIFFWNSKGIVGDPMAYLTKVRSMTFEQAKDYLRQYNYEDFFIYNIKEKGDVVTYPKLVEVFHDMGMRNRNYFYDRGLTDSTIDLFRLGYWDEWYTVPFFENDTFRNFQLRRDNPKRMRSYYKGLGALLFNPDVLKLVDKIYYTEGPVDAMALIQNGLPAISSNSAGGYSISWFRKFVKVNEIYILFDNDKAGISEARRLANFLGSMRCKIYTFEDFEEEGYDPVDYFVDGHSVKELEKLIEMKGKYSFELGA